jgi:hypothetical protein
MPSNASAADQDIASPSTEFFSNSASATSMPLLRLNQITREPMLHVLRETARIP